MDNGNGAVRTSATIYQFPAGGKASRPGSRRGAFATAAADAADDLPRVDFGSGWYHDAAMADGSDRGGR